VCVCPVLYSLYAYSY